jgi:hypothetical protein
MGIFAGKTMPEQKGHCRGLKQRSGQRRGLSFTKKAPVSKSNVSLRTLNDTGHVQTKK